MWFIRKVDDDFSTSGVSRSILLIYYKILHVWLGIPNREQCTLHIWIRPKKKLLVWRNKGLENRVGWAGFFCFFYVCECTVFFKVLVFVYYRVQSKKQQHNFIPHILCSFQCFIIVQIGQNEVVHMTCLPN